MKLAIGDKVKASGYSLQPKRNYWNSCGDYTRKNAAKRELDKATALRGEIFDVTVNGAVKVKWSDGTESHCLDYMVEKISNQSGSALTDFLMVTLGALSILALVFTLGALPALILFAQLATALKF